MCFALALLKRIDGILKTAEEISTKLSVQVQEVCFKELQMFVKRYVTHVYLRNIFPLN